MIPAESQWEGNAINFLILGLLWKKYIPTKTYL